MFDLCQALSYLVKKCHISTRWLKECYIPFCKVPAPEYKGCLHPQIVNSWSSALDKMVSFTLNYQGFKKSHDIICFVCSGISNPFRVIVDFVTRLLLTSQDLNQMGRTFLCEDIFSLRISE